MQTNKLSSHPPSKKPVEEFILAAEQKKKDHEYYRPTRETNVYPWEAPSIRQDVQKVFTVKLPEEYLLKIKFISDKTNKSQQKIIREIISSEIDKLILQIV